MSLINSAFLLVPMATAACLFLFAPFDAFAFELNRVTSRSVNAVICFLAGRRPRRQIFLCADPGACGRVFWEHIVLLLVGTQPNCLSCTAYCVVRFAALSAANINTVSTGGSACEPTVVLSLRQYKRDEGLRCLERARRRKWKFYDRKSHAVWK